MITKDGGSRLLTKADLDPDIKNRFGHPLIGWRSTSAGEGGLYNPRGFAMLRIIVQKLIEGQIEDLYDQPALIENPGSIVVCRAGEKVGMVKAFRMVGERILEADANYVAHLNEQDKWHELFSTLGAWRWEVPRGIPPASNDQHDLNSLALQAAKIESKEEAGFDIQDARVVGRINTNPTFFAHAQYAVAATLSSIGQKTPEELEIIGNNRFFTAEEIRAMVNGDLIDGVGFDDGMSKAAMADAGFHY